MSGLEAGSLDVFSRTYSSVAISAAQARTGNYSLYVDYTHDVACIGLGDSYTELFLRIGLYMTGGYGTRDRIFCILTDQMGHDVLTFKVRYTDKVILVLRGDYNDTEIASGGIVPTNSWCCIEIHAFIDNTGGIVQVKIDGTLVIDFSGDTQKDSNEVLAVLLGDTSYSLYYAPCTGYYDDLAINDPSGNVNNSWLGQGGIIGLVPTGAGNYTQLTPSAGANWAAVDEVPPDDGGTYVEEATVNRKDTYKMQDLPVASGFMASVTAVQWLCRALNTVSGNGNFARLLRIAGVDYQSDDIGYDRDYSYHPEIVETSPATGAAWTESEINNLEVGMVVR